MKEVNFKDRVPLHPGRFKLTPVIGETNTYDLERADEPTEPGTPLDKATFNSIVHSRLTGRYYSMGVTKKVKSKQTYTVSPIPKSGWVVDATQKKAQSGSYTVEVNSLYGSYTPEKALDGNMDTEYRSDASGEITLKIDFPSALKVTKFKIAMRAANYTYAVTTEFQGSSNGTTWTTLFTTTEKPSTLTEYTLTTTGEYTSYRLKFTATETGIYVYEFQISAYEVSTYFNEYTITEAVPATWTTGQRITVSVPTNSTTFAITSNTLNGVNVNTILQPGKRYELVYNGTAFDTKEV